MEEEKTNQKSHLHRANWHALEEKQTKFEFITILCLCPSEIRIANIVKLMKFVRPRKKQRRNKIWEASSGFTCQDKRFD